MFLSPVIATNTLNIFFTLDLFRIIAGAPKAVNKYLQVSWSKDNTSGTVFKCNASEPSFNCTEQIMFDNNRKLILLNCF